MPVVHGSSPRAAQGASPGEPQRAVPPTVASSARWVRLSGPVAFAATMGAVALALHLRDPHSDGAWGKCPTLYITGLACPFCGGLRAVNDLTDGDWSAALSSNAALVVSLPLFAFWWLWLIRERWAGRRRRWTTPLDAPWVMPTILALLAVFTVVRNLPFGSYLYP